MKMMSTLAATTALFVLIGTGPTLAQPAPGEAVAAQEDEEAKAPFDAQQAQEVATQLADLLEENFVFPDIGLSYAQMLRGKVASGAYSDFPDADAFAEAITEDLQALHPDGHLMVRPPQLVDAEVQQRAGPFPPGVNTVTKSGWLAPGVAYARFDGFPGNAETLAAIEAFLTDHAQAETLILDARGHFGGGLAEMNVLFPALFTQETDLVYMELRAAVAAGSPAPPPEFMLRDVDAPATLSRQAHYVVPPSAPHALADAKVFLLVGPGTASAGEHLAMSLQRTGRATLVGEKTMGAGHFGGMMPLGHGYDAFVPVGRTFDPDTGKGWEGTGVLPDVEVAVDDALDTALRLAGATVDGASALAGLAD